MAGVLANMPVFSRLCKPLEASPALSSSPGGRGLCRSQGPRGGRRAAWGEEGGVGGSKSGGRRASGELTAPM
ncbi:hypothetical protein EYF80_064980 [Liparis tanakae]|uniref:Uncharacterized protein n=1 Tax=Liparis tanakae TaxID=230148 RepID=A0A4Z2E8P3_9TELE|nr:hypothetical protein EYF80_064980 [Liparis tanakae]